MLPEESARIKIDKQLNDAGWNVISRNDYIPCNEPSAVKEALMQGNHESDYLLFVEDKAIAIVEAKRESNDLGEKVAQQAENYALIPQNWYGLWYPNKIPLVYLANGKKIYFKNMLLPDSDYIEISKMHSPKKMLQLIGKTSEYGVLPKIEEKGLRDCQYNAECKLEKSFKEGHKKALAVLATGSGKTYLACLAAYRLLNYTSTRRVLFLADRNNLARQAASEFSTFDRTENQQQMSSIYSIKRLVKEDDIKGDIVISTIQKLYAVLTGQAFSDKDEDMEDELNFKSDEKDAAKLITIDGNLKLPPDYFQFIIIDECHRSIYGRWKAVLDYFKDAKILGLTATPTPEAYAFFNKNKIEEYTYDESVVDGVNVPARVYRIKTESTEHGGTIDGGTEVTEKSKYTHKTTTYKTTSRIDYSSTQLDRTVINPAQIRSVLTSYRDAIYTDLYPDRKLSWEYIPKTLIFAKDDNHATQIVEIAKEEFADKFKNKILPDNFVQKITYSAGDSNALIRDLRIEKDFRIAVTVTLVATGTDVKPLEVVLFMNDVKSPVLYTQMKGRGCRYILEDKLREVTPNADTKECFYIVDAVGVTEHDKTLPDRTKKNGGKTNKVLTLEQLIEHLSHKDLSDENLELLRNYCSTINKRYEDNPLFGRHLDSFIKNYGFAPRTLANSINKALSEHSLPPFLDPSAPNTERLDLLFCLIGNDKARKSLLEMQKGFYIFDPVEEDKVILSDFSKETARSFIDTFEKYLLDNKDQIEALRIIYNSENKVITNSMLCDLKDKLLSQSKQYTPHSIWNYYKILDTNGSVDALDLKHNVNALTNLIQIVRYAYKKSCRLTGLFGTYIQRFNLYCGQAQRNLSETQKAIMQQIAEFIVNEGAFNSLELNEFAPDLWREAMNEFEPKQFSNELYELSKFILRAA